MAIYGVPTYTAPGTELAEAIPDYFSIKNAISQNSLRQAQSSEAMAKAKQATMLANLLGGSVGAQGNNQPGKMNVNQALAAYAAMGIPAPTPSGGKLFTAFGTFDVGETPEQKRVADTSAQASGQTLKSVSQSELESMPLNVSFKALHGLMDNPAYANIAGTAEGKLINAQPFGIPVGSWLQKTFPKRFTPEEANVAGLAKAHMGNIVTSVSSKFKGPFKAMVGNLINEMKPNMGDSIETQKGKLAALEELNAVADNINSKIDKYINDGMSSTAAILRASQETDLDSIINNVRSNYKNKSSRNQGLVNVSPASKALSKNLQLPKFNSKQEFLSWYKRQDKMVQDAVRLKLGMK